LVVPAHNDYVTLFDTLNVAREVGLCLLNADLIISLFKSTVKT